MTSSLVADGIKIVRGNRVIINNFSSKRECLMVCVWEPIPHKEISQNDYCDKTRSGR